MLRGIERLIAERNRLIGWVLDDAGLRVSIQAGDRVALRYRDRDRIGVVVRLQSTGFMALEDGSNRVKCFRREGISTFKLLPGE